MIPSMWTLAVWRVTYPLSCLTTIASDTIENTLGFSIHRWQADFLIERARNDSVFVKSKFS